MNILRPLSKQPIPPHAKKVFGGVLFDVYQWEQKLFDGTKTTFEKLKRRDTVVVFPILDDGRVLLTKQEQPGKVGAFMGATGGGVHDGEEILDAAKRELLEESGYDASEFILWDAQQPSSKIDWVVYTFLAKGLKKVSDMNLDGGERITLKPVNFDEFIEIGIGKNFAEKEIVPKLYEVKLYPEKKEALRKLFLPI